LDPISLKSYQENAEFLDVVRRTELNVKDTTSSTTPSKPTTNPDYAVRTWAEVLLLKEKRWIRKFFRIFPENSQTLM
jgi:hypothetical protein